MSNAVMIGRQPIFNRDYQVVAYELLYRGIDNRADDNKTAQVVVGALIDLGQDKVAGALPVYFNVDESFLLNESQLTQAFEPEQVNFEIMASVPASDAILNACRDLRARGFRLSLDGAADIGHIRAFKDYVDVIKIDWLKAENPAAIVRELRHGSVKILAKKIDSYEQAEQAKLLNVDYYQGYFFCKPDTVSGQKPPESKMSVLRAMQQAMSAASIDDTFEVIRQDVSLSYRLLKYINSAAFGLRREVQSIEQALSLLGLKNIRRWLTLLAMTSLGESKPTELIRQALFRARFLESLARHLGEPVIDDDFIMGLFSILDALLDCSMQQALQEISLADHIRAGLIDPESPMGKKLALSFAIEQGDWDAIKVFIDDGRRMAYTDVTRFQTEAMQWADEQMSVLTSL